MAFQKSFSSKGATYASGYHRVREVNVRNYLNGPEAYVVVDSYANKAARDANTDANVIASGLFHVANDPDPAKAQNFTDFFKPVKSDTPYDATMKQAYAYLAAKGGYAGALDV